MRKITIISISAVIALLASSVLFAQEQETLMQKIMKRFKKEEKPVQAAPEKKATAAPAAAKKDTVPAAEKTNLSGEVNAQAKEPSTAGWTEEKADKAKRTRKDLTKEELVQYIKDRLDREEEVLNFIPELKKETDAAGNMYYAYQGVRLENLDKEKLDKLFLRVQNELVRIRTERLNRQLESIRRIQRLTTQQQVPRVPNVTIPPPTPQIPRNPPATIQVPRTPSSPPSPPPQIPKAAPAQPPATPKR